MPMTQFTAEQMALLNAAQDRVTLVVPNSPVAPRADGTSPVLIDGSGRIIPTDYWGNPEGSAAADEKKKQMLIFAGLIALVVGAYVWKKRKSKGRR